MTDEPVEPTEGEKTEEQKDEDDIGAFLHDVRQHGKRVHLEAAEDMDELAASAEGMRQYGSGDLADQGREWEASADEHRKRADEWAKLDDEAGDDG
jgi:hypothetical protein